MNENRQSLKRHNTELSYQLLQLIVHCSNQAENQQRNVTQR
jgi:hypothetical protein